MRRLLLGFIAAFAALLFCFAEKPGPVLRLETDDLDMGTIMRDSTGSAVVKFYNDGTEPLAIVSIFSDCYCTTPEYTKDPVAPGDSGVIKVSFSARGRAAGPFRKAMRIRTNGDSRMVLFICGDVANPVKKW